MFLPTDRPLEKWFYGERWETIPLKEDTWEYNNTWIALDLNYQIVPKGYDGHTLYDPMLDTPELYLKFVHLADFEEYRGSRLKGSEKECIDNILMFFHDYGPLWFPGVLDSNKPFKPPLTIVRVLSEAQEMASVVKTYRLLSDVDNLSKSPDESISFLKQHMIKLQDIDRPHGVKDHLITTKGGLRIPINIYDNKTGSLTYPHLDADKEIMEAAVAYVLGKVNEKLGTGKIYLALANQEGGNQIQKDESQIGAWVQGYRYESLLTVLWLQFYLAILKHTRLKLCANEKCPRDKMFIPNRPKQQFCSNSCRVSQFSRMKYERSKQTK